MTDSKLTLPKTIAKEGVPTIGDLNGKWIKSKIKRADKLSAWLEATQLAGFTATEANKFFGRPRNGENEGLTLHLREPIAARAAYTARHAALLAQMV